MSRSRDRSLYPDRVELDPVRDAELAEIAARDSRDEAGWVSGVVIFESTNESELTVARSLLEAKGREAANVLRAAPLDELGIRFGGLC